MTTKYNPREKRARKKAKEGRKQARVREQIAAAAEGKPAKPKRENHQEAAAVKEQ
ncbi:MAG: hypothetical protein IPM23_15770 [Candidatus Melainabacteria bacterium]|nr:hypothetical protein [Candidatus Melainabacteria bacterium]